MLIDYIIIRFSSPFFVKTLLFLWLFMAFYGRVFDKKMRSSTLKLRFWPIKFIQPSHLTELGVIFIAKWGKYRLTHFPVANRSFFKEF